MKPCEFLWLNELMLELLSMNGWSESPVYCFIVDKTAEILSCIANETIVGALLAICGILFCEISSCVKCGYEPSTNCPNKGCRGIAELADSQISHVKVLLITGWQEYFFNKAAYPPLHCRRQL